MLFIYGSFQHINTHIMMFEHNKSSVLCLHYCIVTLTSRRLKRCMCFIYFIGYIGSGIPVATMQKGSKSDVALLLT